jgi:hypothetical protein
LEQDVFSLSHGPTVLCLYQETQQQLKRLLWQQHTLAVKQFGLFATEHYKNICVGVLVNM